MHHGKVKAKSCRFMNLLYVKGYLLTLCRISPCIHTLFSIPSNGIFACFDSFAQSPSLCAFSGSWSHGAIFNAILALIFAIFIQAMILVLKDA